MKMFVVAMGALFAVSACGKKDAAGGGGDTGAPTCDKFLKSYEACLSKAPEAAQGALKDGLKQMKEAWAGVPKDAMEASCKQALDGAKQAMAQMCPDVKWD